MQYPAALARILSPLVRGMMARGMTFPDLSDLLKKIFVDRAQADFNLEGKRMTDSRISLLTGLQRRDVKAHRTDDLPEPSVEGAGSLPRVLARWLSDKAWCKRDGSPRILARNGEGLSFESLVASVSRDMHARTLLDELLRQGAVEVDRKKDTVTLLTRSYIPTGDEALMAYFGANLGDHAEAATSNLLAAPEKGPFFERAVHYNQLSDQSVARLDALARRLQDTALKTLNEEALKLQTLDAEDNAAAGRVRCGAFIFSETGGGSAS